MVQIMRSVVFVFFLVVCQLFGQTTSDCSPDIRLTCQQQETCGDCMLVHLCCNWCYDNWFSESTRCDTKESLYKSNCTNIELNQNSSHDVVYPVADFKNIHDANDATTAIQMKPQKFKVVLRPGQSVNISFTYQAAKNYPLDLYYLGDLSHSMRSHLDTLKNLGGKLSKDLEMLTKHYKLAFGSFLDKPGMPFILTDKKHFANPCRNGDDDEDDDCGKTYLFRHSLNFTSDTRAFFEKVKTSKISANIDDLDGALEAIHQVLVCRHFGWSENSRKIIVLSTDSYLHTAGDGLLVGATKVNDNVCLMDADGNHMDPLKYDYPSVDQIRKLLREYKTNLIVAVTEDKRQSYDQMEEQLLKQESFIGVLSANSTNILELVSRGYYDFIRQVEFAANSTTQYAPELEVEFFSKCDAARNYEKASGCSNVAEGVPIDFKLQLTLTNPTMRSPETIFIKEKSINDVIEVEIEYVGGKCKCSNITHMVSLNCENGYQDCGKCHCKNGWEGDTCSVSCDDNSDSCRMNRESRSCSGVGECLCGKCICEHPYEGQYCEYECPTVNNKKCAGNGICNKGICTCNQGFKGEDCACIDATDQCQIQVYGDKLCSGKGTCVCNQCECIKDFSGKYCEWRNSTLNDMCNMLDPYVQQFLNSSESKITINNITAIVRKDEGPIELGTCDDCSIFMFVNNTQRCTAQYCYGEDLENVHVTTRVKCVYTAQAMGIGLALAVFAAIVLGGLVIIVIRKVQIWREETAELNNFYKEQERYKNREENPLYVSPITEFKNPVHASTSGTGM